ncbi:MAG: sulfurtransferase TusA family protein [Trueperaceae bacterium]|jgi:TusA-related sulfurtransferase
MTVHLLDNRNVTCSMGLVRVRQKLSEVPVGDLLEVRTRDRFAPYEVPAWVERVGLEMAYQRRKGFWLFATYVFCIRKVTSVAPPRVRLD